MTIKGETNILKIYNLSQFIDISSYDLNDYHDLENLKETVASYFDAGELDAFDVPVDLTGLIPDTTEIEINDNTFTFEDITYKNIDINALLNKNFKKNSLLLILRANGDGYFEYDINPNIKDIQFGYSACDINFPQETVYEQFCDLILPEYIYVNNKKIEVIATNFYPKDQIIAEIYNVNQENIFEKITQIDLLHLNWDLFEDLIKVEYD